MQLSIEAAERIARECVREAALIAKPVAIAVVDAEGVLLCTRRPAGRGSVDLAMAKAYSAAVMGRSTIKLEEWQERSPVLFVQLSQLGPYPILADFGGVTVRAGGAVIGGLGVTGATGEEDQRICQAVLTRLGYESDLDPSED